MKFVDTAVRQPVTVTVGVILVLLVGLVGMQRIPIQLTPNVEDTIVAVTTFWEGASPQEIEQEVVDEQEEKLQGIANLETITSTSQQSTGTVRLEFKTGTPKAEALREVSDKLREVPDYPENVDEPVIEASDPENRDYIAWILLQTDAPDFDVRTLQDFAEDRIKPRLERIEGMSEINVLGGREREVQIRFDPVHLAQLGIPVNELVAAIAGTNRNVSAGRLTEDKSNVRVRLVSQYTTLEAVEDTVVRETAGGPILVRDVAEVSQTFKEPSSFVRSGGRPAIAINAQKEVGANVMEVIERLDAELDAMNAADGLLATEARERGIGGALTLRKVYDQTIYIDDALELVQSNIWLGGSLAILVLLLFLRSIRSAGIVALAIPISVIGAIAVMVSLGRSINVISLAGMAFAVGMVVDNAIVVLENVYRHLEMGKTPMRAALDGANEVFGAVVAATLTTVVVFIPILLIEQEAGQLFRDIALAIIAAVALSLLVSVTVIPSSAARLLKPRSAGPAGAGQGSWIANKVAGVVHALCGSTVARVAIVLVLTVASLFGTYMLAPPLDYLPQGNRNLVFGLLIPPPGYNIDQLESLATRIEQTMAPYYEAGMHEPGSDEYERAKADLPTVPTFDMAAGAPGDPVTPPPIENYFLVTFDGIMFHGAVSAEPDKVADVMPLFQHATRSQMVPGVLAFGFQVPLFQLGGSTGSAVKVNFSGDDLDEVSGAALLALQDFTGAFGPYAVQPDPSNFNIPGPELQVVPDLVRLGEVGMTPADLGLAVQALGDGAILGDYRIGGQSVDLKLVSNTVETDASLERLADTPLATPSGARVPVASLASLDRVNAPPQINRTSRQRSITLQVTPPAGMPLEQAVTTIDETLAGYRASGRVPSTVAMSSTGSASKLAAVKTAMLGDGSIGGTLSSSLVLALIVVYLLMCVLFQSFVRPLIIMFSVPLATLGGFAALFAVFVWSTSDRYMPVQNLDILTMLGFVILIGVVVNNAILIVHQSLRFMAGSSDAGSTSGDPLPPREAITEAVRSRVRPIFMSTATSVGGMAPLVLMPGSGSELYRGLGSVVLGGLIVSTVFTLLLVPLLLSLVTDLQTKVGAIDVEPEGASSGSTATPVGVARARRSSALWLAATLAAGLGATACARPHTPSPPSLSRLVEDIARGHVEALAAEASVAGTPAPRLPESRLPAEVADRIDELERLGGPSSYEDVVPPWDADLFGQPRDIRPFGLRESIVTAAERNLGLQASSIAPAIAAADVIAAEAAFDPIFLANARYDDVNQPQLVPVLQGVLLGTPDNVTDTRRVEAGVQQLVSATGATVSFSTFLQRFSNETDGIDFAPDPAWTAGVAAEIVQPLLRGFGRDVTMGEVVLQRNAAEDSEAVLRRDLLTVIDATEQAYRTLDEAWRLLRIQQHLVEQGEEVERVLRARRDFDARPTEYSDALAVLEQRRADLIRSRRAVDAASDLLKAFVNDTVVSPESEILVTPSDEMAGTDVSVDLLEAVGLALENRPDVAQALLEIHDTQVRETISANRLLPRLDLGAGVRVDGLEDDERDAYTSLASDDFSSVFLSLALEVPIGNRAARARHRQAVLAERAALVTYSQVVQEAILDVKTALRDLVSNRALVDAARTFRIAQTDNLRALLLEEQARRQLTPEFLALKFQRQERLAEAQREEVRALANFHRALSSYRRATGTALSHHNVVPIVDMAGTIDVPVPGR